MEKNKKINPVCLYKESVGTSFMLLACHQYLIGPRRYVTPVLRCAARHASRIDQQGSSRLRCRDKFKPCASCPAESGDAAFERTAVLKGKNTAFMG